LKPEFSAVLRAKKPPARAAKAATKRANAPWLEKVIKDGVEEICVFKIVGNSGFGGRFLPATPDEIENGIFFFHRC
jgi:hypothetical protein